MEKKKDLLHSILMDSDIISKNNINDLSKIELEVVLSQLIYGQIMDDDSLSLIRDIMNRLYTNRETEFYIEVLKCSSNDDLLCIINKYSSDKYSNEMFCRSGLKTFLGIESKILSKKGYPKIKDVLISLFEWLQDLNWPGADEIVNILLIIPNGIFITNLETSINLAIKDDDIEWLINMKDIVKRKKLLKKDFNNPYLYEILMDCD